MDYEQIKKIIDDMGNANIDELEIEFPEGTKISMKKNQNKETIIPTQVQPQTQIQTINQTVPTVVQTNNGSANIKVENTDRVSEENYKIIKAPMVGTFYASPAPDKDKFVNVGDVIKKGQVVCIVEAMKLMNEIESEFEGEIVEICAKDGEIVEYGMPMFKIK